MIISDLQFINSINTADVKGGSGYGIRNGNGKSVKYYQKHRFAFADASADALAFGDQAFAVTDTTALADSDLGVASSTSDSTAFASSSYYVPYSNYY